MARRPGPFGRLIEHFHTHPRGRLHEILFWVGLGLALGAASLLGWLDGVISTPFALMFGIVAACLVGWAFLPQHRPRQVAEAPDPRRKSKPRR